MVLVFLLSMCLNIGFLKVFLYFMVFFLVFLMILIIFGNFFICLVIMKDFFSNLKMFFNYFLLSLVMIDLVVGMIMDFVLVVFYISEVF